MGDNDDVGSGDIVEEIVAISSIGWRAANEKRVIGLDVVDRYDW